jgi:hypothetical protein
VRRVRLRRACYSFQYGSPTSVPGGKPFMSSIDLRRGRLVLALARLFALFPLSCFAVAQARFDGPAELPRIYVNSSLAASPAPGSVISVHAGENLQAAVNGASCGDRIELQAGAEFTGTFRFPEKPCDDQHWIIVRTGAPDSDLPPEGTRLKPCFAGVAALPGRPDFHCTSTRSVLPKLVFDGRSGLGPIIFLRGANHYRFLGIEITRTSGPLVSALAIAAEGAETNHLIFDRVWMHGTPQDETTRALALTGMTYVAVVDSFFTDFHCIAVTGSCTDAQVLGTGGGRTATGPFKIVNNFMEAAGENILFGGGGATMTPADIEIRHNHFFKPMIWKQGEPGFVAGASGHPFIVKNLFELKNAQRVLLEGNLLENSWGGFSQNGYAILLTPKNQSSKCPLCLVTDVTIRYNRIANVGAVFQIANVPDDHGGFATAGERYSIHDVLAENVRGKEYAGSGLFAQLIAISPPLRDVQIEHVIAFAPRATFAVMNTRDRFTNFTIANNILSTGEHSIVSSGGGQANCAGQPGSQDPAGMFKNCFSNSSFVHNLMIGDGGWPPGNPSAKDARSAGIRELHLPGGNPYELCTEKDQHDCKKASPALHAGSDGKDLGPDFKKLDEMLANVD